MMRRRLILVFCLLVILSSGIILPQVKAASRPLPTINLYLSQAGIAAGKDTYATYLQAHRQDAQARFGLGMLQFFSAVEELAQNFYQYGLDPEPARLLGIPFLRLPVPENSQPAPIDYQQWQVLLETLHQNLQTAEATLAQVGDVPVKLPINFTDIRLDLNGDETLSEEETFWQIYRLYNAGAPEAPPEQPLTIGFDTGYVYWLMGYCHLLMTLTDTILAYDTQEYFERLGHLFFSNLQTPYGVPQVVDGGIINFVDVVTALHLLQFEPQAPERLSLALNHARSVLALSHQSWDSILAEEDNDREWVPNADQTSVVPAAVTGEQIEAWRRLLDEADAVLTGEKLLPHWRFDERRGINLQRAFLEPQFFDLVLWVQGGAALPYLEVGELAQGDTWRELIRVFGGNFTGFAIWFN
ncbi:MAG: hypothetical protein AAF959_28170 [Cyanobacteria bacterium P01_D01_bin.56]